jgi:carbamoyltransferase
MPHPTATILGSGLVLGVHIGHDRSAALVKNGRLVAHVAQERLDRVKMSSGSRIPFQAILAALGQTGYTIHDVDAVGFSFENCMVDRLAAWFEEQLACYFDLPKITAVPVAHHVAHAWSVRAFSGFARCAVLVCDGAGDLIKPDARESGEEIESRSPPEGMEGESLFLADGDRLELCDRRLQSFLHDLYDRPFFYNASQMPDLFAKQTVGIGRKYEQFTYFIGFGNEQNGKTMGLASYGRPLVDLRQWPVTDFSYRLTLSDILREIEEVAAAASMPTGAFLRLRRADAASTVQQFTEEALLGLARYTKQILGESRLCLSGGVFLNCIANHKIARSGLFTEVFVQPACGDEGHAMGAAFAVSAMLKGCPPKATAHDTCTMAEMRTSEVGSEDVVSDLRLLDSTIPPVLPYAGLSHDRSTVEAAIARNNLSYQWRDDAALAEVMAAMIENGRTVGLLRGRSELGPRALGHRSILADPRSPTMKDHLNAYVKFREAFRPYAPMVLAEYATDIFDLAQPSPFMLFACDVKPKYQALLPAVTHVDGTARVQTVDGQEPFLRALLMAFYRRTGIPVLLNTSFNLAGEPIVETPEDAIRAFLSCGLDVLVLEGAVITKTDPASDLIEQSADLST